MNTEEGDPIIGYLVYDDFDTALARADLEGSTCNLPFFFGVGSSRYRSYPQETVDGKWALDIKGYSQLTDDEISSVVLSVALKY